MAEICPVCGLPKSICVCKTISHEQQKVRIKLETRKYKRPTTTIEGLNGDKKDLNEIASKLKSTCACGGGYKNGIIILQGDHRYKAKEVLIKEIGIPEENIEII